MAKLDQFLVQMIELGASDLHLHADYPLTYRVDGMLRGVGKALNSKQLVFLLSEILSDDQKAQLNRGQELDFAYEIPGHGRFRGNIFLQDSKFGGVFRLIPSRIVKLEDLNCPVGITKLCQKRSGLILVTGPTGSGKSTTMAAMIDHLNHNRRCHIITIEDPVEFVHEDKLCILSQKEVGKDVPCFTTGLKIASKENPDIVLVGEIRDRNSMQGALDLAEAGVLVLATLHTVDVANTVKRVMSFFEEDMQDMIRSRFAFNIQGIVSMKLLPKAESGRVAAYEIVLANQGIRSLIMEGKDHQIASAMEQGKAEGMRTFNMHIKELVATRMITKEIADRYMALEQKA